MTAVTITGGDRAHGSGDQWCVPKRELLTGLESSLECGELRMGAEGEGEHDDLTVALSLACWRAKRPRNGFGTRRLPGI